MYLFKRNNIAIFLISLISLSYLLNQIESYASSEDEVYFYDDYNNINNEDKSLNENNTKLIIAHKNEVKYDYESEGMSEEENSCSLENLMSSAKQFLPDDYEQGKNMTISTRVDHINETVAILRRLEKVIKNMTRKLEPTLKRYASQLMSDIYTLDLSNDCLSTLVYMLTSGHYYGFRFIDSTGLMTGGLSEGTRGTFGEYDQCLDIESPDDVRPTFRGQYCLGRIKLPLPARDSLKYGDHIDTYIDDMVSAFRGVPQRTDMLNPALKKGLPKEITKFLVDLFSYENSTIFRFGLCLPSTCRATEIEALINSYVFPLTHMPIEVGPDCDMKGKPITLNCYQLLSLIAFLVVIGLTILSTVYEISFTRGHKPSPNAKLFCSFSIISNTKTLGGPSPALSCLDGLRVLFLFWIVFIHTYVFTLIGNQLFKRYIHGGYGIRFLTHPYYVLHRNLYIIDFFFLISGLLITYIMMAKLKKSGGKFNIVQYVVFRYLRMTPTIVFSIFIIWLTPLVMSGPVGQEVWNKFYYACVDGWTSTLMYINNYEAGFPEPFMCVPTSWSIAAEYHMYIIAPIFFLTLYSSPKFGVALLTLFVILTSVANIVPLYFGIAHYFEWQKWRSGADFERSVRYHFFGSNCHMAPYFLGLLFGYILRKYPDIKLSRFTETMLWIVSWSMTIGSMFWSSDWFDTPPHQINLQLFLVFGKLFWCAGWCWLIYACATGRAKNINNFLSSRIFKPLSGLSLEIGLLHTMPIMYRYATWRYALPLEDYHILSGVVFDFIFTCVLSFILYLLVGCPLGNLMQIFLLPQSTESKKNETKPIDSNGHLINLRDECTKL